METDRMILKACRLLLREMVPGDYTGLYKMLKDLAVMEMPHLIYSVKKLRQAGFRHKFI